MKVFATKLIVASSVLAFTTDGFAPQQNSRENLIQESVTKGSQQDEVRRSVIASTLGALSFLPLASQAKDSKVRDGPIVYLSTTYYASIR